MSTSPNPANTPALSAPPTWSISAGLSLIAAGYSGEFIYHMLRGSIDGKTVLYLTLVVLVVQGFFSTLTTRGRRLGRTGSLALVSLVALGHVWVLLRTSLIHGLSSTLPPHAPFEFSLWAVMTVLYHLLPFLALAFTLHRRTAEHCAS